MENLKIEITKDDFEALVMGDNCEQYFASSLYDFSENTYFVYLKFQYDLGDNFVVFRVYVFSEKFDKESRRILLDESYIVDFFTTNLGKKLDSIDTSIMINAPFVLSDIRNTSSIHKMYNNYFLCFVEAFKNFLDEEKKSAKNGESEFAHRLKVLETLLKTITQG